ncbi:DUF2207 domain-containing protein [Herbiconiux flava]|uniref:DUF2207 domain-containing protein n=1 Tax=Herbiconiux flava TaxID=881268 RepID=A0A852SMU3_9MICO|nr:DUF2207 domain-containing protein [Herbiconiux flava]NYD70124.1 hypothetical protein [Herbiconiux flava]GLK16876.1 hypothetical protein GCM10017602_13580 [Herbiconiux flava]
MGRTRWADDDGGDDISDDSSGRGDDHPDTNAEAATGSPDERVADAPPQHTALWVVLSRWLLAAEAWLRSHGGTRLRNGIRAFWALVAVGGLVLLFGPVINEPLSLEDITGSADTATDTWIARDFDVDYTVERGDDGRLTAHVEETITAFFPDDVEETGIRRVLATHYQGHALEPSDVTATVDGVAVEPRRSETSDQMALDLEAPDTTDGAAGGSAVLQGDHVFVITYDLHDLAYVTTQADASNTADDENPDTTPVDLLEWDVFGPDWRQALAGLDVSVTLPDDVDAQLLQQPRGTLAWLLIGGGEWLAPEPGPDPGTTTYGFSNDQNMPPYAQARFRMVFEPGTFTMPAPTALFWLQTYGPLAPLAILSATLLLALAARAVAWSDARGRPWFIAQYDPPKGVSVRMAAQILREPAALELAEALAKARSAPRAATTKRRWGRRKKTGTTGTTAPPAPSAARQRLLREASRVAARTGRLGDRPRALSRYLTASERAGQLREGIRRLPRGFVRDLFIAAPLALTVVQWGLVRQLSHQTVLAVVWWPVAFVLLSSAIAVVVLAIALTSRPLTRKGALLKQHLRGIGVYAERTRMLARGPLREDALAYAVLQSPPREAGRSVVALIDQELGEDSSRGWRSRSFLGGGRIGLRMLALLLVAGAVAAVAFLPSPFPRSYDYATYSGDVPGALFTTVQSLDAVAELTRDDDGAARLAVTETLDVTFDDEGSRVPQFAQQWPREAGGQDLGLRVEDVRVDGGSVPFATRPDGDTLLVVTRLVEVLDGSHEVEVDYVLGSAAVAAGPVSGGAAGSGSSSDSRGSDAVVDSVRWAALLESWEYDSNWGDDPGLDPLRLELRMPESLASEAVAGGWITLDTDSADEPSQWAEDVIPFGSVGEDLAPSSDSTSTADDMRSVVLDLKQDGDAGWPFELTTDDLGARLDFPAGTFAGPDPDALAATRAAAVLPVAVVGAFGGLALLIGLAGLLLRRRHLASLTTPGLGRDLVRWLAPALGLAAIILFIWMTIDMPDDRPEFAPLALAALAAAAGTALALTATRRPRPTPTRTRP